MFNILSKVDTKIQKVLCTSRAYQLFLKDGQYVRASYAGDAQVFRKGKVGLIAGLETVVSTKVPDGVALVFRKDRFTKMTERPVYTNRFSNVSTDSEEIYGYARFGRTETGKGGFEVRNLNIGLVDYIARGIRNYGIQVTERRVRREETSGKKEKT